MCIPCTNKLYALTFFREWSVPDSGSLHTIEGRGVLPV